MDLIISFLNTLQKNNNREWFNANKSFYEEAKNRFVSMVGQIIKGINTFDKQIKNINPRDCIFRIYRDTRFSKDKTPYKTNFGAYIAPGGLKSFNPGYYFHLQPMEYFVSAGIYKPPVNLLYKIRSEIFHHYEEFVSIVNHPDYQQYNIEFFNDKLKRPPKGFNIDFQGIEWLKYKSYAPYYSLEEQELFSPAIIERIIEMYRIMYPLNRFILNAIS